MLKVQAKRQFGSKGIVSTERLVLIIVPERKLASRRNKQILKLTYWTGDERRVSEIEDG